MNHTFGTFYAVGVGPGDASLLTLRAARILAQCPVIAAPQTASGQMLALDIARGALDLSEKEILPLLFSMSHDPLAREESYRASCARLEDFLSRGQDVAMVTLGDVSIYATAYYIYERLRNAGFPAEMVPGVTSFSAVAAQLGWSLTEENAPLHILPGASDLQDALSLPGTKVLMKSGSAVRTAVAALEQAGLVDRAALVCDCGLPTQKIYRDLRNLPERLSYFATIVVREG